MVRAAASCPDPAASPTTSAIGRLGKVCAGADVAAATSAAPAAMALIAAAISDRGNNRRLAVIVLSLCYLSRGVLPSSRCHTTPPPGRKQGRGFVREFPPRRPQINGWRG